VKRSILRNPAQAERETGKAGGPMPTEEIVVSEATCAIFNTAMKLPYSLFSNLTQALLNGDATMVEKFDQAQRAMGS
jgi:hypothetical protein